MQARGNVGSDQASTYRMPDSERTGKRESHRSLGSTHLNSSQRLPSYLGIWESTLSGSSETLRGAEFKGRRMLDQVGLRGRVLR